MVRRTTVRVRNETKVDVPLLDAQLLAGTWSTPPPPTTLPAGALAAFSNDARGRFGSARGRLTYEVPGGCATLEWNNPFVGRNTYRMEIEGANTGCICDGDDDDQDAVVTFTLVASRRVTVRGFTPARNGFRFTNSWSGEPLRRIDLKLASIPIGKASNGLCGGMVYAACDWFEAGRPIPDAPVAPDDGSVLRSYVIDRLIDSFDLPGGIVPYVTMMSTRYPADDGDLLAAIGQVASRAGVLARRTWPTVKQHIDAGHPCPLGLVMVESDDVADLEHQHQVLAYGYWIRGTEVTLWVYDPNAPGDNRVTIAFDTARTDRPIVVDHRVDADGPLVCAFVPRYVATTPPSAA